MEKLLQTYSPSDILVFIAILAVAVKGCINFLDWAKDRTRTWVKKDEAPEKNFEQILSCRDEMDKKINQEIQERSKQIDELQATIEELHESVNAINKDVALLVQSDKDDIKSYITKEYHYWVEHKGWIDTFSMDCIEKRYEHYLAENGNSFIKQLMEELRALPKAPNLAKEKGEGKNESINNR